MSIEMIPPSQIHPNPWQTRFAANPAHIRNIADSIATNGLLQIPVGRRTANGVELDGVELAVGHTRFAAWQLAKPGEPMPVEIKDLTDKQMSEAAIIENAQRQDLSAIEKAKALQRHIQDFHVTQKEAGALFGLKDQSSVSNLLKLLKLPAGVQTLLQGGELPERFGRQIVPFLVLPKFDAEKVAQAVAGVDEKIREQEFSFAVDKELRAHAKRVGEWAVPWKKDFPTKPIKLTDADESKGEPKELIACQGCAFHIQYAHDDYCLRPACWNRKALEWGKQEAQAASKRTGIKVAKPDESVTIVYDGSGGGIEARTAVESKLKHLRLVPTAGSQHGARWNLESLFGTDMVVLGTTDLAAYQKETGADSAAAQTPEQRAKQDAKQKQKQALEQRKREHFFQQKDIALDAAARFMAPALPANSGVLSLFVALFDTYMFDSDGLREQLKDLQQGKVHRIADQQAIVMRCLLEEHFESNRPDTPNEFRKEVGKLASDMKVKLGKGWDNALDEPLPDDDQVVDKGTVKWLLNTPSDDVNFKSNLERANLATLRAALEKGIETKTARAKVEARIRKLEKAK